MMSPMPSKTLAYVSWLCFPYLLFYVTLLKNRVKVKCANMWALKIRLFCQAICLEQIVAIQKIKPVFPSRPLPIPPFETHLWMKKWTNACSKKWFWRALIFDVRICECFLNFYPSPFLVSQMIFYVFNHGLLLQAHYAAAKLNQFLSKKKILCALIKPTCECLHLYCI